MRHAKRFLLTLLLALLFAVQAFATPAKVVMYIGPTGQTLYARFETSDGVYLAFALVEGTGGGKGRYYAYDSDIVDLGLATPGTYIGTVHSGSSPSTTAEDAIVAEYELVWNGGSEVTTSTLSPVLVDDDDTWTFSSPTEITSKKILAEAKSPAILKAMDFTEPATKHGSISAVTSVTVADVSGATEPTVTTSAKSLDQKKVVITFDASAATAATYTVTVTVVTTDSQTIIRKGKLTIE